MADGRTTLPLFPLDTVLFPGLVLPLHVFEERYRQLVGQLLDHPEDERRFGVVAITLGHEVGNDAVKEMADVGCVAEVRRIEPHDDGRYDLVTVGGPRFRVRSVDGDSLPYLRAETTPFPDQLGDDADALAVGVTALFWRYCAALRGVGMTMRVPEELPHDPATLSYLVAASLIVSRPIKQQLLEAKDIATRLRYEQRLLRRESALVQAVPALPGSAPFGDAPGTN
ncbi:MAG: LON peptidase substrate-binding domain-containing protein [Streptosporangiaceae bacterium]